MHTEHAVLEDANTLLHAPTAMTDEAPLPSSQILESIMKVLQPARPPEPKNARIIRRFDLEAAANDRHPEGAAPAPCRDEPAPRRTRSREEARAQRNTSLLAAAGLA